jgi:hypothetical protein
MKQYFPQILEVVHSTYSASITPYVDQLRDKVCTVCTHQTDSGRCALRDEVECALDRYFPLVVEVIEDVQWRKRMDKGMGRS